MEYYKHIYSSRDRAREKVRLRDNYTCRICFKIWKDGERRFDIHHLDEKLKGLDTKKDLPIKYDRENQDKLITLCHSCHIKLHYGKVELIKSV